MSDNDRPPGKTGMAVSVSGKTYIGDAVYVYDDGYGVVLTTEDGRSVTNRIVLEPEVWENLAGYVARLKTALAQQQFAVHQCCRRDLRRFN